jgi:C1A family cysteine protease
MQTSPSKYTTESTSSLVNILGINGNQPLFHWSKDKPDSRDYLYRTTKSRIPLRVDLRGWCTTVEDQGNLGSCTGQAIAGAIEYLNKRYTRPTDVSRLFIYYYERELIGTINWDSGAYIRDGIKVVSKKGAPLERHWPYNINRFATRPSNNALVDGLKRKVTRYERATNLYSCLDALAAGFPVVVGFLVYSSFMSRAVINTGVMPYPNVNKEAFLGGHAVLLVGYDSSTGRFIARNSWGSGWGDRGYFYMPYNVISNTSMSSDFWVIKGVNNP